MEFLSNIPLVSFIVFLFTATTILNPVFAQCNFPAIYNFGASNSDTGGFAAAFIPPPLPNGETYFNRSAGRFCDGRIIIDFIAQNFGLPFLHPYLDSLGSNFSYGANFATFASTITVPHGIVPEGKLSPFDLQIQIIQFTDFKPRIKFLRDQGGVFAPLMPKDEDFGQALYTFDIGQNDLTAGIFMSNSTMAVIATIPDIVNNFSENIKILYNLGARSFWIHNTGPIGCLPLILTNFPTAEKDSHGCAKSYNEVAQNFNQKLKEALAQLRQSLSDAAITYVDVYSVKYSLFSDPKKYGFELPLVACCGYGGNYNFSNSVFCGGTTNVNDTQITVGSCEKPTTRVIWDGIHYTEAANKVVFDQISTGSFTDPPIPLNKACQRNFIKG